MDVIDVAQRRQQEQIDQALANLPVPGVGAERCTRHDCDEPISATRQQLGARLCIDCANAQEQEARRWSPRGQG